MPMKLSGKIIAAVGCLSVLAILWVLIGLQQRGHPSTDHGGRVQRVPSPPTDSTLDRRAGKELLRSVSEGLEHHRDFSYRPEFGQETYDSDRLSDIHYEQNVRNHLLLKTFYASTLRNSQEFHQLVDVLNRYGLDAEAIECIHLFNMCRVYASQSRGWDKTNPELLDEHEVAMRREISDKIRQMMNSRIRTLSSSLSDDLVDELIDQLVKISPDQPFRESQELIQEGDPLLIR